MATLLLELGSRLLGRRDIMRPVFLDGGLAVPQRLIVRELLASLLRLARILVVQRLFQSPWMP